MDIKKFFILALGVPSLVVTTAIAVNKFSNGILLNRRSVEDPYILTLDSTNVPSSLTNSYQDNVEGTFVTALGNQKVFNFVKAKKSTGNFVELAPKGMVYTFGSEAGELLGIFAVTVTYTGSSDVLRVRPSLTDQPGSMTCSPIPLTSGQRTLIPSCDYLSFVAGDSGNVINSITLEYTCEEGAFDIKKLNGTYTGIGDDDDTYSLTFSGQNGGDVTLTSLDRNTNIEVTGTATMLNDLNIQCSFTSPSAYNGLVLNFEACDEYYKLNFVSKSGTGSDDIPQVDLYRVYDVENFEGYSETGIGWDLSNDQYSTSGARNAYVCEYKKSGSDSGPIGGSGWSLMGSTDYLDFNASKGRNNSKTIAFKNNTNEMAFYHMKAYFGMPSLLGRGTKLSFWARSPYSNKELTTDSQYGSEFTFQLYYTPKVTGSTKSQCTERQFYIPAGSDWTEYTMDIDETKNYYSFSITTLYTFLSHNNHTTYVPIDDIKIYTDTPYVSYPWNNPGGNFHGHARKQGGGTAAIVLALANDGAGIVRVDGTEYGIDSISYDRHSNQITIETDNNYIGTLTAIYDKSDHVFTNLTFPTGYNTFGRNKLADGENGNITCSLPDLHWSCDEDSVGLREQFIRRYNDGNGTHSDALYNEDRIVRDVTNYRSLGNAMKIRPYTSGGAGFALANDFETAQTVSSFDFWVYNPNNSTVHLRMWTFAGEGFTAANEFGDVDAPKGWSYHSIKFSQRNIYNFQIMNLHADGDHSASSTIGLTYDDIAIHD